MSQTLEQYGYELDRAQKGQIADSGLRQVDSFAAEDPVPFGVGVVRGTDPEKQCEVPADDTGAFLGVALFTHAHEQGLPGSGDIAGYEDTRTVSVMRMGRVWVELADDGVEIDDEAYLEPVTGDFTDDPTGNIGPVGRFLSGGDEGDLAVLEVTSALRGPQGEQGEAG